MTAQRPWLVIVAAPKEFSAVARAMGLPDHAEIPDPWGAVPTPAGLLLRTGVGKAAAAAATARWYDPERHAGVLNLGVAGATPGTSLKPGGVVLADPSLFGDEGVRTPDGFDDLAAIGFGADAPPAAPDPASRAALMPLADRAGPVATVSSCSGTDAAAADLAARTGAIAEAMEGAGVALAARRINPAARFAEVRVISNRTGDRAGQGWDLAAALAALTDVTGRCLRALHA
jgi:futalosine hydrolase